MKIIALASILLAGRASCYEVVITAPPSKLVSDQQLAEAKPISGKTTLIEFLGGADKIKKVVLGVTANKDREILNAPVVIARFANSVCMDSKKDEWMFAPFATGTIHFDDGRAQSFTMGLGRSGIMVAGHLFAATKSQEAEQDSSGNGG
ncbi:MAG: hypothetical protein V4733_12670 [Verrucomicrobiota bacterium]